MHAPACPQVAVPFTVKMIGRAAYEKLKLFLKGRDIKVNLRERDHGEYKHPQLVASTCVAGKTPELLQALRSVQLLAQQ